MSVAVAPTLVPNASRHQFTLTGTGTSWDSETVFAISGITGAEITDQQVNGALAALITVSFGAAGGTLTIDDGEGSSTTVAVDVWQEFTRDDYARADTTVGSAGSKTGAGNNWEDEAGSTFDIVGNQLRAETGPGGTAGNRLTRPASEAGADRRRENKVSQANNAPWYIVLRKQSDGSHYRLVTGSTVFRFERVSAAQAASTVGGATNAPAVPLNNDAVWDFSIRNVGGNPVLVATLVNNTTGEITTITATDTNGSKITASGRSGIAEGSASIKNTWYRSRSYVLNTKGVVGTPSAAGSGQSVSVELTGIGTTWDGSTTWSAAGGSGVTLGTPVVHDATHATVPITNTGSVSDAIVLTDSKDATKFSFAVTAPSISMSPRQINAGITSIVTVTGNGVQRWLTTPPNFSGSTLPSGTTIDQVNVISDNEVRLTITAGSTSGTATITDSAFSASNVLSVIFVKPFIAYEPDEDLMVDMLLSPGNWHIVDGAFAESFNPSAYGRLQITTTSAGDIAIPFDPSPNVAGSLSPLNYPTLSWVVNPTDANQVWQRTKLSPTTDRVVLLASAPAGTYDIWFYFAAVGGSGTDTGRWAGARRMRLLGLQCHSSAVLVPVKRKRGTVYEFGDSYLDGSGTIGKTGGSQGGAGNDSLKTYGKAFADTVGMEWAGIGKAGQHWADSVAGEDPLYSLTLTPPSTMPYHMAGVSRLDEDGLLWPSPEIVLINMGTNDVNQDIKENVRLGLHLVRELAPVADIVVCVPFNQSASGLDRGNPAGFNAYVAETGDRRCVLLNPNEGGAILPVDAIDNHNSFNQNAFASDTYHPYAAYSMAAGARLAAMYLAWKAGKRSPQAASAGF